MEKEDTMVFETFCRRTATIDPLITNKDEDDFDIPRKYVKPVNSLITIMRPKMRMLDRVSVTFIENAFEENVVERLDEHTEDGDIPDSIINTLSMELYNVMPSELSETQSAIIKVLACYICIQN